MNAKELGDVWRGKGSFNKCHDCYCSRSTSDDERVYIVKAWWYAGHYKHRELTKQGLSVEEYKNAMEEWYRENKNPYSEGRMKYAPTQLYCQVCGDDYRLRHKESPKSLLRRHIRMGFGYAVVVNPRTGEIIEPKPKKTNDARTQRSRTSKGPGRDVHAKESGGSKGRTKSVS